MPLFLGLVLAFSSQFSSYHQELDVSYATADGRRLTLNAFVLDQAPKPTPAMVDIHGGWFLGGGPATSVPDLLARKGIAFFSVAYRLGDQGGFPQCIRDCRNAIRFLRKNAVRFNIDPDRIACMGGSAGGHLSLMVAMVDDKFDDGGPADGLEGVSARVCGCLSWCPPTDFVRFWEQGPDDRTIVNGKSQLRPVSDIAPNDSRPHLRSLFHGVAPDTRENRELYTRMSPIGHVSKHIPPVLICDGAKDPIVPGQEGKELHDRLKAVGADSTYWLSPGGHEFPSGDGFFEVLDRFVNRIFKVSG